MQSGAESLDTIATWWQKVSTLSSLPKNHPHLEVRQAKKYLEHHVTEAATLAITTV